MARGGYDLEAKRMRKKAVEEGDQVAAANPDWMPKRAQLFISGHTPRTGHPTEALRQVIDAVVSTLTIFIYTFSRSIYIFFG